jgi:hypothetical protein
MRRTEQLKWPLGVGTILAGAFFLLGVLDGCSPRDDAASGSGLAETNSQAPAREPAKTQTIGETPVIADDSGSRESGIPPAHSSVSPGSAMDGKGKQLRAADTTKGRSAVGADVVTESGVSQTGTARYPVAAGGIVARSGAEKRDLSSPRPQTALQPSEPIVANNNAVAGNGESPTQAVTEVKHEQPPTPAVLVSRHVMVGTSNQLIVSYSMELNRTINESATGMVLSQILPRGWSLVRSKPEPSTFDPKSRVAKWLLLPDQIQMNAVEMFAVSDDEMARPSVWNEAICWYTYRQASDGRSMTFNADTR